MAKDKKGFILYADLIKVVSKLPDETAGKLFKIILRYVNDLEVCIDDLLLEIAFEPIKNQLKRDLIKFEEVKAKRSEAGKRSAELRAQRRAEKDLTNPTSVKSVEQASTNPTVIDTVNVTVNDTDTVTVSTDVDVNSFYDIDILKNYYLKNEKVIKAIIINKDNKLSSKEQLQKRLEEFNEHLKQQSRLSESFKEYSKYFLNWNRKKKEIDDKKPKPVTYTNPYKEAGQL